MEWAKHNSIIKDNLATPLRQLLPQSLTLSSRSRSSRWWRAKTSRQRCRWRRLSATTKISWSRTSWPSSGATGPLSRGHSQRAPPWATSPSNSISILQTRRSHTSLAGSTSKASLMKWSICGWPKATCSSHLLSRSWSVRGAKLLRCSTSRGWQLIRRKFLKL